jgi:hypothetical protein
MYVVSKVTREISIDDIKFKMPSLVNDPWYGDFLELYPSYFLSELIEYGDDACNRNGVPNPYYQWFKRAYCEGIIDPSVVFPSGGAFLCDPFMYLEYYLLFHKHDAEKAVRLHEINRKIMYVACDPYGFDDIHKMLDTLFDELKVMAMNAALYRRKKILRARLYEIEKKMESDVVREICGRPDHVCSLAYILLAHLSPPRHRRALLRKAENALLEYVVRDGELILLHSQPFANESEKIEEMTDEEYIRALKIALNNGIQVVEITFLAHILKKLSQHDWEKDLETIQGILNNPSIFENIDVKVVIR